MYDTSYIPGSCGATNPKTELNTTTSKKNLIELYHLLFTKLVKHIINKNIKSFKIHGDTNLHKILIDTLFSFNKNKEHDTMSNIFFTVAGC